MFYSNIRYFFGIPGFGYQSANQTTHRFTPFNFYEIWARRVLVKCSAESNGTIHYFPLDRGGISENSENYVHLVIIGMTRMGIALAIEAAHIAHFPNFKTHRKKTRITFIDREARREMDFFMGRYRHLFDLSEARFMDCEQDKTFHPAQNFDSDLSI